MLRLLLVGCCVWMGGGAAVAFDEPAGSDDATTTATPGSEDTPATSADMQDSTDTESVPESEAADDTVDQVREQAEELASDTKEKVQEIAATIDQSETAQEVSSGILRPVYLLAEALAFPAFYWVTFMLMVAGTVSFAFQLVLGKVVVLANGSMNIREIFSDAVGLAISLLGLVLTTQAAAQNSTFPESPSSVVSSMLVGVLLGLFLYRWGQAEEVDAAKGRRRGAKK